VVGADTHLVARLVDPHLVPLVELGYHLQRRQITKTPPTKIVPATNKKGSPHYPVSNK
jgi:hypothetical protein